MPVLDLLPSITLIHLGGIPGPDSRATCPLMSSGLRPELKATSKRVDRLQVEVVELAEDIASILVPGAFGDWVLVDGEFPHCPLLSSRC